MYNAAPKVQLFHTEDGDRVGFWCPGCENLHWFDERFEWNSDPINPSFRPSLQIGDADGSICHLFVQDGHVQFLSDCRHGLHDQTVPMRPLPEWLVRPLAEDTEK